MNSLARALCLCAWLAMSSAWAAAVDIKGARFNDTYVLGNQALSLNGAGIRHKFVLDVYAAGLYVPRKEHSAEGLIHQSGPKSMQIVLLRELTGEDFSDAMVTGFQQNNSEADVAKYHHAIDEIRSIMATFGSVRKGSTIRIDFTPGSGVRVLIDGVLRGEQPAGEDFFAAVLRIWLGQSPVDADLKQALMGGK